MCSSNGRNAVAVHEFTGFRAVLTSLLLGPSPWVPAILSATVQGKMDGLILEGKDDGKSNKVHIRMQQRNGRKSWTTVAGFPEQVRLPKSGKILQVDFEKILRALKKTFKTNGVLIKDPDHGSVMQLQGDIRKEVAEFLIEVTAIITKDQVMIHGS
eukprot:s2581_g8.t1